MRLVRGVWPAGQWLALAVLITVAVAVGSQPASAAVAAGGSGGSAPRYDAARGSGAERHTSAARIPAGLRAAIRRTLAAHPAAPRPVIASWGGSGAVTFRPSGDWRDSLTLRPLSAGRAAQSPFAPGRFLRGRRGVTEDLGRGFTAWYRALPSGYEQGFTVARRPPGQGARLAIMVGYRGLKAQLAGRGRIVLSGPRGPVLDNPVPDNPVLDNPLLDNPVLDNPVLDYAGLRVTDRAGRVVPSRLALRQGAIEISVRDAGARYPLTVDPYVIPSTTPAATFALTATSVALSSDGNEALLGVPDPNTGGGSAYLFAESGGTWPTTPLATFTSPATNTGFGHSVALSGDGQTALIGGNGADAYLYTASSGWSNTPSATFTPGPDVGEFGHSVALSANGQIALIGAPASGSDVNDGAAFLYTDTASGWVNTTIFAITGSYGLLGSSVALSADGLTVLVGAPGATVTKPSDGAAYVYTAPAGGWQLTGNPPAPATPAPTATLTGDPGAQADFGQAVALSGDGQAALVGEPYGNAAEGVAYLYTASPGWSDTPAASFTGAEGTNPIELGLSVALSGDGQAALIGNGASTPFVSYLYTAASGWSATPAAMYDGGQGQYSVALSTDGETALAGGTADSSTYLYAVPDTTSTTLSQVGGGGPAGTPVTFTGTVTDTTQSPATDVTSGTVSLYDNGSSTAFASNLPLSSGGQFTSSVTYTTAGPHSVVAVYSPPATGASYAGSTSADTSFTVGPAVACGGYEIAIGTTSATDLCDTWPAGSPPPGITASAAGNWTLDLTGTMTLPSTGDWIFCVADAQDFTMEVDGQLVLTNEIYEQDGNNGDINFQFLGTYAGTTPVMCEDAQLTSGQHQVQFDIEGNTSQSTSYNIAYQAPATTPPAGLPLSILSLGSS